MFKAIIVDDEIRAINNLKWEIEKFCPEVKVVESFTNPGEAISGIDYLKPDCVFLDIEMPQMDGFQLLKSLRYKEFSLIITTAYNNYAIKAFKENAIDYLLKPIDSDDLRQSVQRLIKLKKTHGLRLELDQIMELVSSKNSSRISIPLVGKTIFVEGSDILYCKADGNYTEFHFIEGNMELITKSLKDVIHELLPDYFFRVHNSYTVNINHIKEYIRSEGHYLIMINNKQIPISRSKRDALLQRIAL